MTDGTSNPRSTLLPAPRAVAPQAIPDIPAVGDISQTALRQILTSLRQSVAQLSGDGLQSAMTLERALELGIVRPKPPSSGGSPGRITVDPYSGYSYGGTTWSGATVPPPPTVEVGEPSEVSDLQVSAGFSGVYLTWSSPERTGGSFQVWRAETNDRGAATRIATVTGLSYYDSTVAPGIIGDGTATGKQYYYWIKAIRINLDGTIDDDTFFWSGGEDEGVPWELNPNTFSRIVADNILAGRLKVALDFSTDGSIRSGKELVDGVPNSAAGFFLNGNYFYFGSDGDGSYIRWSGDELEVRGNITGSFIRGSVIDGAILSGTLLFARDIVYDGDDPALPVNGLYQNDYAGLSPENVALGPYEVRYLVRNETLESSNAELSEVAWVNSYGTAANGLLTHVYEVLVGNPTTLSIPQPFDYFASDFTRRCKNEDCFLELYLEYTSSPSRPGGISAAEYPMWLYARGGAYDRYLTLLQFEFALTYGQIMSTDTDGVPFEYRAAHVETITWDCSRGNGTTAAYGTTNPANDPQYVSAPNPGENTFTTGPDEFGSLLWTNVFTLNHTVALPDGAEVKVVAVPSETAPESGLYTGTHTVRIRKALVDHTGRLDSVSLTTRYLFQTYPFTSKMIELPGATWRLYAKITSDNTI